MSKEMNLLKHAITSGQSYNEVLQLDLQEANTPNEREQGLINTPANTAMTFPNSTGSFTTKGMNKNLNISKFDNQGNIVQSYRSAPPGIDNLPMGNKVGTVIETPSQYQTGGLINKYQDGGSSREEDQDILEVNRAADEYNEFISGVTFIHEGEGFFKGKEVLGGAETYHLYHPATKSDPADWSGKHTETVNKNDALLQMYFDLQKAYNQALRNLRPRNNGKKFNMNSSYYLSDGYRIQDYDNVSGSRAFKRAKKFDVPPQKTVKPQSSGFRKQSVGSLKTLKEKIKESDKKIGWQEGTTYVHSHTLGNDLYSKNLINNWDIYQGDDYIASGGVPRSPQIGDTIHIQDYGASGVGDSKQDQPYYYIERAKIPQIPIKKAELLPTKTSEPVLEKAGDAPKYTPTVDEDFSKSFHHRKYKEEDGKYSMFNPVLGKWKPITKKSYKLGIKNSTYNEETDVYEQWWHKGTSKKESVTNESILEYFRDKKYGGFVNKYQKPKKEKYPTQKDIDEFHALNASNYRDEALYNQGNALVDQANFLIKHDVDMWRPDVSKYEKRNPFKNCWYDNTCVEAVKKGYEWSGYESGIPEDVYDNKTFLKNYKEYGFEEIKNTDTKNLIPGDILQYYTEAGTIDISEYSWFDRKIWKLPDGDVVKIEENPFHMGIYVGDGEYFGDGSDDEPLNISNISVDKEGNKKPSFRVFRKTNPTKIKRQYGGFVNKYQEPKKDYNTKTDENYEKWKANLPKNLQTETEDYNLKGAYEAGMKPIWNEGSQSYHLGSVDVKTGSWLKSMDHPTAWMEYKQYYLTPGKFRQEYTPVVNPEGYFGDRQLKYYKSAYQKGGFINKYQGPVQTSEVTEPDQKPYTFTVSPPVIDVVNKRVTDLDNAIKKVVSFENKKDQRSIEQLLKMTAFMENSYGKNKRAYNREYTNSMMSIDTIMLNHLFDKPKSKKGVTPKYTKSQNKWFKRLEDLGLPSNKDEFQELLLKNDPLAAIAATRMAYAKSPKALPKFGNVNEMFNIYYKDYNRTNKHQSKKDKLKRFESGWENLFPFKIPMKYDLNNLK